MGNDDSDCLYENRAMSTITWKGCYRISTAWVEVDGNQHTVESCAVSCSVATVEGVIPSYFAKREGGKCFCYAQHNMRKIKGLQKLGQCDLCPTDHDDFASDVSPFLELGNG